MNSTASIYVAGAIHAQINAVCAPGGTARRVGPPSLCGAIHRQAKFKGALGGDVGCSVILRVCVVVLQAALEIAAGICAVCMWGEFRRCNGHDGDGLRFPWATRVHAAKANGVHNHGPSSMEVQVSTQALGRLNAGQRAGKAAIPPPPRRGGHVRRPVTPPPILMAARGCPHAPQCW